MFINVRMIASNVWSATKADGTVVEWQQEGKCGDQQGRGSRYGAAHYRFWLMKLLDDICRSRKISLEEAKIEAGKAFRTSMLNTLTEPWPSKWGMTIEDFNFDVKYHL